MKQNLLIATCLLLTMLSCNKTELNENILSSSTNDAAAAAGSGLVAWYTFDGDTLDHSNHGNNVIFNSATPAVGKNGLPNTAFLFDGSTSYMMVPNNSSLNPKKEITLAALIKVNGFYQGACHGNRIINKGDDDGNYGAYNLGFDDGLFYSHNQCSRPLKENRETFWGGYGDGFDKIAAFDTANYIKTNKWYQIVFTVDSNQVSKLYVNGNLKSTNQKAFTFSPRSTPLYIGRLGAAEYPYFFNGVIDEIRIYNKALDITGVRKVSNELGRTK